MPAVTLQLRHSATCILPSLPQDPYKKYDADEDDDDDSVDQEPPYRSLTSPGGMRRFGTLASLEMLDDTEQVAEDSTDSDDHGAWDSDIEEGDCKQKQEVAGGFARTSQVLTSNTADVEKTNLRLLNMGSVFYLATIRSCFLSPRLTYLRTHPADRPQVCRSKRLQVKKRHLSHKIMTVCKVTRGLSSVNARILCRTFCLLIAIKKCQIKIQNVFILPVMWHRCNT